MSKGTGKFILGMGLGVGLGMLFHQIMVKKIERFLRKN